MIGLTHIGFSACFSPSHTLKRNSNAHLIGGANLDYKRIVLTNL